MRKLFVDTFVWIALIDPKDNWHSRIKQTLIDTQPCKLVTTDEVLSEVLTFYSKSGSFARKEAAAVVKNVLKDPDIEVREQTRQSFVAGLSLYQQRPDKGYSITDCVSMNTMKQLSLTEVLTHDKHFSQEGFVVLFQNLK